MSYTNIVVPTCSSNFKTLGPYDDNLINEFNKQLELERSNQPNSCPCQNNLNDLGYSQNLTTCIQCLGLKNSPSQTYSPGSQPWGCDSCQNVVAPVSYYENTTVANADQIEKYYTDSIYKNNVDVFWDDATACDKGTAIKNTCINNLEYFINTPESTNPPTNPPADTSSSSSGLSTGAIICIIIGSIFLLALIFIWFWKKTSKNSVHSKAQKIQKQKDKLHKKEQKLRLMQQEKEESERLLKEEKQLRQQIKQKELEIDAFNRQGKGKPDPNLNYGQGDWTDDRKAQLSQYYPQQPQQQHGQFQPQKQGQHYPQQPQKQGQQFQPQQHPGQHQQGQQFQPQKQGQLGEFIDDDFYKKSQEIHYTKVLTKDDSKAFDSPEILKSAGAQARAAPAEKAAARKAAQSAQQKALAQEAQQKALAQEAQQKAVAQAERKRQATTGQASQQKPPAQADQQKATADDESQLLMETDSPVQVEKNV